MSQTSEASYKTDIGINDKITDEMLLEKGIDSSVIKVCKTIRKLAKLDRLRLDDITHRSGLNKHLYVSLINCIGFPSI